MLSRVRAALSGKATVGTLDISSARPPVPGGTFKLKMSPDASGVQVTAEFLTAMAAMEEGVPAVFVTGRAGTGKSTFIRYVCSASECPVVVAAPTGIAALNCGGQTIHSLFHLPARMMNVEEIRRTPKDPFLFKTMQRLVIDEVSMVRADTIDIIDQSLRKWRKNHAPFGGVQIIFVGDLLQLPPVVTEEEEPIMRAKYASNWFFDAQVMKKLQVVTVELTKVFRQQDEVFIDILSRIRMNEHHRDAVAMLNNRCFREANEEGRTCDIILTSTNRQADAINKAEMDRLPGSTRTFKAVIEGSFSLRGARMPAPEELVLKEGAQVMVVKNTSGCVNGTLAKVIAMTDSSVTIRKLRGDPNEDDIVLSLEAWDDHRYTFDHGTQKIGVEVAGRYKQIPLRPAWAVTTHKSQGLTLDSVKVDLGRGAFAEGQTYVALSRVRTMEGLVLARPISMQDVKADPAVVEFYRRQAAARGESL